MRLKKTGLALGASLVLLGLVPGCKAVTSTVMETAMVTETITYTLRLPVSSEVTWDIEDTRVYATVTRPDDSKIHPAVVFVPGSGPTDRDWNSPLLPGTNGSAKLLAAVLAEQGYVTIRYDKRFTGAHAQENLAKMTGKISLQSHVDEIAGAYALLARHPNVDPARIFVLANSEGAIHALNYQRQAAANKFAGIILASPPGRGYGALLRSQIAAELAGLARADAILALYDAAIADFLAGNPVNPDPALPEGLQQLVLSLNTPINLPFTREIWDINAATWLTEVNEPTLVIIGKKDIQVDWQVDGKLLQDAAAGMANVTFSFPDNANHVLKYEDRAREVMYQDGTQYNAEEKILDPAALVFITEWLGARQ